MSGRLNKIITGILTLYIVFGIGLLVWTVIYSGSNDGDTLEHVHSSWMVYHGKIPYKDFFQHHNPLLWYLGAPLVGWFEYSLRAVDAVNLLTVCATATSIFYIYRLHKDFLTNALGGLIAAAFYIFPHESLYDKDFKPDNYMVLCFITGIYYLFCYLKNKKLSSLIISFMLFFAAFMFTQKVLLIFIALGILILYLTMQQKISWSDIFAGLLLPVLFYAVFLTYLWSQDILMMYFKANFELNSHIPAVFYTRRFIPPTAEMCIPMLLSLYALGKCMYNGNKYVKMIGILFIAECIIRLYYFTPFIYYFALLHILSSILAGVGAMAIISQKPWSIWLLISYFVGLGSIYAYTYSQRITVGDSYKYGASGFVLEYTTPCDYVLNGYRIGYNLFNKDVDFIWNLQGQIDVIASTIGIRPLSNLEELIRKHRPKIIHGKNYYDTYREYRGEIQVHPIHWISTHLLNEMYNPLGRDDLYILKPEYQSFDCRYNPRTKSYEYRDRH